MSRTKSTITPTEQTYRDAHGLMETPKCPICGKHVQWSSELKRYKVFCSTECRLSEQGKQITHQMQVQKMLETRGVTNAAHLESTKQKRKETMIEKHGVEHYSQTDEYKEKYKKTCLERFGVENSLADRKIRESIKQQWEEKTPEEIAEIIAKRKETSLKNWGVDNPSKSDEINQRKRKSFHNNYWELFIIRLELKQLKPLFTKEEYCTEDIERDYECLACGNIFKTAELKPQTISCGNHSHNSIEEINLRKWLNEIGIETINNYRDGLEIDIYAPHSNIGIEYNGIYWHSNLYRNNNFHQQKYLHFKEKGIDLIQVFENEWKNKQSIVKSIIKSKFKLNETIYARKCVIKEIDHKTYQLFCEQNHLQGSSNAKVRIGLFFNTELVQCISLSKPRFNKRYQWELIRSCSKLDSNIIGGFNKLITYFKRQYKPDNIITYCDARYFNGVGYQQAGFELVELTAPDFFYFHKCRNLELFHRTRFQKHMLSKKLKVYDPNKTAELNMLDNGYNKIYDAGNLKFVWTNKKIEESEDSSNM